MKRKVYSIFLKSDRLKISRYLTILLLWLPLAAGLSQGKPRLSSQGSYGLVLINLTTGAILDRINPELVFNSPRGPGSLIKLFLAYAGLSERSTLKNFVTTCPGSPPGQKPHCWKKSGHGPVNFLRALALSCNYYFRKLAAQVETAPFLKTLRDFGIQAPRPALPSKKRLDYMIGGEDLSAISLIQLLYSVSALFNHGFLFTREGNQALCLRTIPLKQSIVELIQVGLSQCLTIGTCMKAAHPSYSLFGKTGTSRSKGKYVGWFIGFFPYPRPKYGLGVIVLDGRGPTHAAPIAKTYLINRHRNKTVEK